MAQESYADYSIIHKYLEQKKLHEEEMQRYKDTNVELNQQLADAQSELNKLKEELDELQTQNEETKLKLRERDNEVRRLTSTISTLNQKIAAMTKGGRR